MRLNIFGGLRPFKPREAGRDALAGVTLASMNIPQVLGYTRIAGTPVVTGLYTVLLPLVAFAVFGSSRHLVVAADSATAAIFSASLSRMAKPASENYMALVGMVALLTAGFLFLARIFKLGFLADFLSRTVLVGFLTGVGFQVGIAMLGDMLGVAAPSHRTLIQVEEDPAGPAGDQSSDAGAFGACGGQHPARPSTCPAIACCALCGRRDDCGERYVPLRRAGHCGHWSGPRGAAID
jgi:sulfate permease, SulP family